MEKVSVENNSRGTRPELVVQLLPLESKNEWLTGVCFLFLGLSSWIAINGVFQELPVMAPHIPESYDIFNYAALIVSISNVIPAVYVCFVSRMAIGRRAKFDNFAILVMVGGVGVSSCLLIGAFWDHSVFVLGKEYSGPLFVLIFLAGAVDSLTSVLFYPLAGRYRSRFALPCLNVGESLTGLVASLLAAAQVGGGGSTYAPNFSVFVFHLCLGLLMAISICAFLVLECGGAKKDAEPADEESTIIPQSRTQSRTRLCSEMHIAMKVLLAQMMFSFLENGVHVSLVSHCLSQFPNAGDAISIALKISFAGGAVFSLVATKYYIAWDSRNLWVALSALCWACAGWIVIASSVALSPGFFEPFTVCVVVLLKWGVVYGKTSIFVAMPVAETLTSCSASTITPSPSYDVYRWGGVGIQIGGVSGSLLFFLLTVQWDVFPY